MTTNIDKLNKALGTWEVASHIFDIDNGKTLEKCLEIAKVNNANDFGLDEDTGVRVVNRGEADWEESIESIDEDWIDYELDEDEETDLLITKALIDITEEKTANGEDLPANIVAALKHFRGGRSQSKIKLGANKSHVGFHGLPVSDNRNPIHRANRAARYWAHLGPHSRHENFELELVSDDIESLTLTTNEGALSMLQTAAAKSIEGKGTPSPKSVASLLPKEWNTSSSEDYNMPVVPDFKTASFLPPEFSNPKINSSVDNSYSAIAKRTAAAKTIERSSKIDFKDEEDASQLPSYWAREKSAPVKDGAATYKSHPQQQKQYAVDLDHLQSPRP